MPGLLLTSSSTMRSPATVRTWGPEPLFAVIPAFAAFGAAGWIWLATADAQRPSEVRVTALRPTAAPDASPSVPIEVSYGVPDEKTMHLWSTPR